MAATSISDVSGCTNVSSEARRGTLSGTGLAPVGSIRPSVYVSVVTLSANDVQPCTQRPIECGGFQYFAAGDSDQRISCSGRKRLRKRSVFQPMCASSQSIRHAALERRVDGETHDRDQELTRPEANDAPTPAMSDGRSGLHGRQHLSPRMQRSGFAPSPGSGDTTFIRRISSSLARWRVRHLAVQQCRGPRRLRDATPKRLAQPRLILVAPGAEFGDGDILRAGTHSGREAIRRRVFRRASRQSSGMTAVRLLTPSP